MSKSNLYQTAAYVTAFSVAEKFFGFLYRIILSRTLGAEGMGIYQVALSVFAVLATAAASGIPLTVSRLITKYRTQKDGRAQHSVVTAALVCALCFSVPVFCILRGMIRLAVCGKDVRLCCPDPDAAREDHGQSAVFHIISAH